MQRNETGIPRASEKIRKRKEGRKEKQGVNVGKQTEEEN